MSPPPVSNPERRAATRERLLDAAAKVFAERGFQAASVSEIAREAGFSIGALYSNFASKDELFVALVDEHVDWMGDVMDRAGDRDDQARAWIEYLKRDRDRFLLFIEFWAYAMRNPEFRPTFAGQLARMRTVLAERLLERGASPEEAQALALGATVLARGLAFEKLGDPDGVPDDAFARLLDRLAG